MPAMPRLKGKAKEIAFKILGVPQNLQARRSPNQVRINTRLVYEETQRVR